LLKKAGRSKKVIFYTPDAPPLRFKNQLLNRLYWWVDSFCVKYADLVWNNSNRMIDVREKKGLSTRYRSKQIEVPMGTDEVKLLPFRKINHYEIAFVGHLKKGQGLELLIDAFSDIVKQIPRAKLLIIGSGPLEEKLKLRAKDLDVEFAGFMGEPSSVYRRVTKSAVGIAPYEIDSSVKYCDSGKVKLYLSAGLPVVVTSVPEIAHEIDKKKCGTMISYDREELVKAVVDLLKNEELLKTYRKNVRKLAHKYSYERIFTRALSALKW